MKLYLMLLVLLCSASTLSSQEMVNAQTDKNITKIIVLRHAEKADDGTKDPPLTAAGKERAARLNQILADFEIDALYATPFKRTQETLAVIAERRKLAVKTYQPNDVNFAKDVLQENLGKTIVVAGHSNSSPALVNKLIGQEKYMALDESVYTKLWVLTFVEGIFVSDELWNY
ncbi:MAG TPA: phosphoglycerate mutase family protein [Saprospiraceae bacterium]|nr:phosphoglycerate mutase family protein [Saprospiraceae bacterium]